MLDDDNSPQNILLNQYLGWEMEWRKNEVEYIEDADGFKYYLTLELRGAGDLKYTTAVNNLNCCGKPLQPYVVQVDARQTSSKTYLWFDLVSFPTREGTIQIKHINPHSYIYNLSLSIMFVHV